MSGRRLTTKDVETEIERLIANGELRRSPLASIGGSLGYGTRFVFDDAHVALGPREALDYIRSLVIRGSKG